LGKVVNGHRRLAHPQVLRKEPFVQKTAGRGRGKFMGFRAEEFGPVPRKFAEGDAFSHFSLWRDLLSGLSLRNTGEKFHRAAETLRA
jgi:hypothetical protein